MQGARCKVQGAKDWSNLEDWTNLEEEDAGVKKCLSALSLQERIAITHYILADEQVQQSLAHSEVPNSVTLQAFAENKEDMPTFNSVEELAADLLS